MERQEQWASLLASTYGKFTWQTHHFPIIQSCKLIQTKPSPKSFDRWVGDSYIQFNMDTVTFPKYPENLTSVAEIRWFVLVLFQMTCTIRNIRNTYQITCSNSFGPIKQNSCNSVFLVYTQDTHTLMKNHTNFINSHRITEWQNGRGWNDL